MNRLITFFKNTPALIIHILIWVVFSGITATHFFFRLGFVPNDFYMRTSIYIGIFYINYSFFVPKLLLNKKIVSYIILSIGFILVFIYFIEPLIPHPKESPFFHKIPDFRKIPNTIDIDLKKRKPGMDFKLFFPAFPLLLLFFALSTSIRLVSEWYKMEKQKVLVESQKITSELSFLKAQLNPHFLFNSLNSIYSLANKKSDDTTVAIVTLSELMRYMIYEANKNTVSLQREITHIKNYISLQLLRLKDSSGVRVNIHGDLNYKIEPLLLISFIENAFKYGTDFTGKTNIRIKITVENEKLNLYVFNTVSYQKKDDENSGIGLENIKNRLKLLYPDSHTLEIQRDKKSYEVNLIIKLKKDHV
ncbi:histidine kinase [Tenacibaculum adriaticum]|uniref:Histidine kinase n=1 Tax=Tenacibaculum adriaticum TaxID=413713 RepID=A0A5S5DQA8_9FLAO|nr:histidine kinase [Tenacibaculum adriaticum]TYP98140.1 histidine kinase [Tenacibaculum adriaticum]